jgi:hypothetical protein
MIFSSSYLHYVDGLDVNALHAGTAIPLRDEESLTLRKGHVCGDRTGGWRGEEKINVNLFPSEAFMLVSLYARQKQKKKEKKVLAGSG